MSINFKTFLVIALPIWVIFRAIKMKGRGTKKFVRHEAAINLLFIYFLYLAQMTIFPLNIGIPIERGVNLIPFESIMRFIPILLKDGLISGSLRPHLNAGAINIVGNIIVFIPVGILIPLTSRRLSTFKKTILLGFTTSLVIEVLQFLFADGRIMDIDDLILNSLGVAIGWVVYKTIRYLINDRFFKDV